jgi:hypothetical protein
MPQALFTSFVETQVFPILANINYHDGTIQTSLITDTVNPPRPARTWRVSERITTAALTTLHNFWLTTTRGGLNSFYFYDPFEPAPGHPVGSNYDPTGFSTQGRVTVYFRGQWNQVTTLGRHNVPDLELVEVL